MCKGGAYNVDEYVRAIFDNFAVECSDDKTCADTAQLRDDFPSYLKAERYFTTGEVGIIVEGMSPWPALARLCNLSQITILV